MLSRLHDIWRRHRRKMLVAGAVVGGAVLVSNYAGKLLKNWQEKQTMELLHRAQKNQHYEATQRTCSMSIASFIPSTRDAILKALDADPLTDALKRKPKNKLEVWDELKVVAFSRIVASVYAGTYLVLFIKLQLNHIGAYFLTPGSVSQQVKEQYIGLVEYFMRTGVDDLCSRIKKKTASVVSRISLKQKLSLSQLESVLTDIRRSVGTTDNCIPVRPVVNYFLPEDPDQSSQDEMMQKLVNEITDVMESDDFNQVVSYCLDQGFSAVMDTLAECYSTVSCTSDEFTPLQQLTVPVPKVIPLVSGLVHVLYSDSPSLWLHQLTLQDPVAHLSANVYEAFSQPQ